MTNNSQCVKYTSNLQLHQPKPTLDNPTGTLSMASGLTDTTLDNDDLAFNFAPTNDTDHFYDANDCLKNDFVECFHISTTVSDNGIFYDAVKQLLSQFPSQTPTELPSFTFLFLFSLLLFKQISSKSVHFADNV